MPLWPPAHPLLAPRPQGVLLCVDTPEQLTSALRRAVAPGLDLPAAKLGDPPFSKSMVPGAAMVWIPVSMERVCWQWQCL